MSKLKRKKPKIKLALCQGCNRLRRPNRVKMVDPRDIGIQKAPVALCAYCRSKLVWKPIEIPDDSEAPARPKEVSADDLTDMVLDLESKIGEIDGVL